MKTTIPYESLTFKRNSGQEKTICPNCSQTRSNKKDKSFSFNHDNGIGHCHYCEAICVKETRKQSVTTKNYKLPEQEWQNHTNLSNELVKWVASNRKIRQETLIKFRITEESYVFQNGSQISSNIVFNYFEGEKIVNKKYRSADKKFFQTEGGKPILYNINTAVGAKELWITEGEFDVLALSEVGIDNAVSIPNGANDSDAYWQNSEPYLKNVSSFIIATDNDEKGVAVREKIAQRLGRHKCFFVEFEGKDANDDLISGTLHETVKNVHKFPVSGTITMQDIAPDLFRLYREGLPKTIYPIDESFGDWRHKFSLMRGHLCVVTGIPSHGKSSFTQWYLLNIVKDHQMKVSFFSPEHSPTELYISTFASLAIGKSFFFGNRMSEEDVHRYVDWANEKIYITNPDNGEAATWEWIIETFKQQMFSYGVDIFVVDAWNKVTAPSNVNQKQFIDSTLTKLTAFAQAYNVIIILVAHPTKMQKNSSGEYERPTLYDVSGSADFRNQTHDGFCVHRFFPSETSHGYTELTNLKNKYNFQGELGASVNFLYDDKSGRFYAEGTTPCLIDLTRPIEEQQSIDFSTLSNSDYIRPPRINWYDEKDNEQPPPF